MRSHEAGVQAHAVERALEKAILNLPFGLSPEIQAAIITNISGALLECYMLGATEALECAPWETAEVAYRTRPTPKLMGGMTRQGWRPWALSETMVPPPAGKTGPSAPGWLVRYTRRMVPTKDIFPVPEKPPADQDHTRGG